MLFDEVKEILASQLDISEDKIDMDTDIFDDLGADSYDMVDIAMTLEDQYSIEVPDEALETIKTVEDLVSYIESNID